MTQNKDYSRWWPWLIGSGLAVLPIHNLWLTRFATLPNGETVFFLPSFGYLLFILATGQFLLRHWDDAKASGWGDKRVLVCLLVIVTAISLSGITAPDLTGKLAPLGMALCLISLYATSRILGTTLVVPIVIGSVTVSLGVIVHAVIHPGQVTGGFVFAQNYDAVVGYILMGSLLYQGRWKWWVWGLGAAAIVLTGSPEGLFCLTFLLCVTGVVAIIYRRAMRITSPLIFGASLFIICLVLALSGVGEKLYSYTWKVAHGEPTIQKPNEAAISATDCRLAVIKQAMTHIKPLGDGYSVTYFADGIVHNVPLIIVQQLGYPGIVAGIAWVLVAVLGLWKAKRWRVLWAAVLAMSVFDHFVWTQFAPWWWLMAGVSLELPSQVLNPRSTRHI